MAFQQVAGDVAGAGLAAGLELLEVARAHLGGDLDEQDEQASSKPGSMVTFLTPSSLTKVRQRPANLILKTPAEQLVFIAIFLVVLAALATWLKRRKVPSCP